jgi:squalene cyclase
MMKNWLSRKVVISSRHLDNLERIAKENQFESLSETIDWVLTDWHRWVNGFNNKNIMVQPSVVTSMSEIKNDDVDPLEGL